MSVQVRMFEGLSHEEEIDMLFLGLLAKWGKDRVFRETGQPEKAYLRSREGNTF